MNFNLIMNNLMNLRISFHNQMYLIYIEILIHLIIAFAQISYIKKIILYY